MSTITVSNVHQEIQHLLPWYINQTLEFQQQQQVEQHLKHCLVCRRDWLELQKLAEKIVAPSDLDSAADVSFAQLRLQLPEPRTRQSVVRIKLAGR